MRGFIATTNSSCCEVNHLLFFSPFTTSRGDKSDALTENLVQVSICSFNHPLTRALFGYTINCHHTVHLAQWLHSVSVYHVLLCNTVPL